MVKKNKVQDKQQTQNEKSKIDDLFSQIKTKKIAKVQQPQKQDKKIKKPKTKKQQSAKFTDEGYKIYTEDDLNLGKGGDTDLCPFDCQCCF